MRVKGESLFFHLFIPSSHFFNSPFSLLPPLALFSFQDARIIFHETVDGINLLGHLLKSPHHLVIYNSMFCLWLLSYNTVLAKLVLIILLLLFL